MMSIRFAFFLLIVALVAMFGTTSSVATCQDCAAKGKHFYCPSNDKCFGDHPLCAIDCREPCEDTKACNGCYKGYNCSCGQCAEDGYSHWCPLANECYKTLAGCALSCGNEADCFKTTYCAPPANCSATQSAQCTANQTCCLDDKANQFCSPYPNGVCCQVGNLTCPQDYVCYPPEMKCLPAPPSPPPHCDECTKIVQAIETGTCDDCSKLFPELSWLCDLINKLGFCKWIETKGLPPTNVCEMMGFCGEEGCTCGYCRPQLYGQWCLSLPNKCPKSSEEKQVSPPSFKTAEERNAHYAKAIRRAVGRLEAHEREEKERQENPFIKGDLCLDGVCEAKHLGCCLTCV